MAVDDENMGADYEQEERHGAMDYVLDVGYLMAGIALYALHLAQKLRGAICHSLARRVDS